MSRARATEAAAKAKCREPECADPKHSYVCTYHEGFADALDAILATLADNEWMNNKGEVVAEPTPEHRHERFICNCGWKYAFAKHCAEASR